MLNGTCSAEVRINIASTVAAMARFNRILRCNTISFASKLKLYLCLVTSILPYDVKHGPCLLALGKKKNQGFQNQVSEKTSLYLLLRAQDQSLGVEQNHLPYG